MASKLTVMLFSLLLATPAVAFWLWLVIMPAIVAVLCPEGFECYTAGYLIDCKKLSLYPISLIRHSIVRYLRLFDSNISLLQKNSFVSLTVLIVLRIDVCGLRTVELEAFNGLTVLRNCQCSLTR